MATAALANIHALLEHHGRGVVHGRPRRTEIDESSWTIELVHALNTQGLNRGHNLLPFSLCTLDYADSE
jgi:hypothetical protein